MTNTVRLSVLASLVALMLLPLTIFAYDAGNDATDRGNVDTYFNFTIVDTNNSFAVGGDIDSFEYYAANTNPFRVVLVDGDVVEWVSEEITPAASGINTYDPGDGVTVEAGWDIAIYSAETGVISFDFSGAPAYFEPNNAGLPTVGETLSYEGNQNRHYSINATLAVVDTDTDDDGILNEADKCEGPLTADDFPMYLDKQAKNRFKWDGTQFITNAKAGVMGEFHPTLVMTYGCTGEQILDAMKEATGLDFGGEYKYGITKGTIEAWIAGVYLLDTVTVNSANYLGANSVAVLDDSKDYIVKASGTWTNRGVESVDAEYSNYNNIGWVDGPDGGYPANLIDLQVEKSFVNWGALNDTTHTYEIPLSPSLDGVVNFRVFDHIDLNTEPDGSWYGDNVGSLTVKIYADLY